MVSDNMQLGHTIELGPQKTPCTLAVGQTLPVMLLHEGRPMAGMPVFGIYDGYEAKDHAAAPIETKTAGSGVAEIKIDRPGKWRIFAK